MSAVQSGFAFLPFSATIVLGSRLVPRAVVRFGARAVVMFGGLAIAAGLVLMSTLDETAAYFPLVFLAMLVMASGAVASFVSLSLVVMGTSRSGGFRRGQRPDADQPAGWRRDRPGRARDRIRDREPERGGKWQRPDPGHGGRACSAAS